MKGCKITLVTLVKLFSTVSFEMCPQIACMGRCIFTLAAFVWFFSTMSLQMNPQSAWTRVCIITLAAFVLLYPNIYLFHKNLFWQTLFHLHNIVLQDVLCWMVVSNWEKSDHVKSICILRAKSESGGIETSETAKCSIDSFTLRNISYIILAVRWKFEKPNYAQAFTTWS